MRYIEEKIISRYPEGVKKDSFQPMLYGYLQDRSPELKNSKTRKAVIICPGGAYRFKSDREGEPIAMRFLAAGMYCNTQWLHLNILPRCWSWQRRWFCSERMLKNGILILNKL